MWARRGPRAKSALHFNHHERIQESSNATWLSFFTTELLDTALHATMTAPVMVAPRTTVAWAAWPVARGLKSVWWG
jgi:hypothetical protein